MIRTVLGLVCLSAVGFSATVTCGPDTLKAYIDLGSTGCKAGLFTIKDFGWNNFGTVSVDPANVRIIPNISSDGIGVAFEGKDDKTFFVTDNGTISTTLEYFIDPPPPILDDFSLSLDANSPEGDSTASITAILCAGGRFVPGCAESNGTTYRLSVLQVGDTGVPPAFVQFVERVNKLDVRLEIELTSVNGAPSQITGASTVVTTTPEPGAAVLAAAGLAALMVLRRRRSS
jgi:MYXO-CTERM domain-containing protein